MVPIQGQQALAVSSTTPHPSKAPLTERLRIVYPTEFEQLDRQRHRDMLAQARVQGVPPASGQAMGVLHQLAARLQQDLPLPLSVVVAGLEQTTELFLSQTVGSDRSPVPAELHAKVPDLGGETLSEFAPSLFAEARRRGLL